MHSGKTLSGFRAALLSLCRSAKPGLGPSGCYRRCIHRTHGPFGNSSILFFKPAATAKSFGSVATFRFCRKTPRFRDFAEKPIVDCEALRQGGFRAKPGFSEESNLCNTSLLLAFQVQRNNVLNFCAGFSIGKQAKSLASVAKRYRPVARIWAVDGRRFH